MKKIVKKPGWEKLVLSTPKPLKAELLALSDSLDMSLAEYVRGVLLTFVREARKQKE